MALEDVDDLAEGIGIIGDVVVGHEDDVGAAVVYGVIAVVGDARQLAAVNLDVVAPSQGVGHGSIAVTLPRDYVAYSVDSRQLLCRDAGNAFRLPGDEGEVECHSFDVQKSRKRWATWRQS